MKRLENLPEITNQMLGGLHASAQLKASVIREGEAIRRGEKPPKRARRASLQPFRLRPQAILAFACVCVLLVGASVGLPRLLSQRQTGGLVTVQTGGGGQAKGGSRALLDVPPGSITISQRDKPGYRGIWAAASGANFPLVCVDGRYYRLLTNPTAIGSELLGSALGQVSTYTSEPALTAEGIISNTVAQGETVYAVNGMSGAMVAAPVNGTLRVFQRVSFGSNALKGGEGLAGTLRAGTVVAMELTGVGTVTDAAKAKELYNILIAHASLTRAGASETGASLLIQLSSGLTLQLAVRDESVMACGTWSCPEFFEAFSQAVR